MTRPTARSLVFHAERLERDDVWHRTRRALDALERRSGRATLFVHPYSAIVSGVDLAPRIAELLARGHEIAQHTHFYAWRPDAPASAGKPPNDLSSENVRRVVHRDLEYLRRAGADPTGFTAGGWLRPPSLAAALEGSGFRYDCSDRAFDLRYEPETSDRWGSAETVTVVGPLVHLPTTASLSDVARRWGGVGAGAGIGSDRYELLYLHDYDLLRARHRAAVRLIIARWSGPWRTAGEFADLALRSVHP